jgi:putative phosphonate metabolism protein
VRYALYFAPERGSALATLANAWLGRDPATGLIVPHPDLDGIGEGGLAAITSSARRYGFHGTLKAPFELADGVEEADLVRAMSAFCADYPGFEVPSLSASLIDGFLALTPTERSSELDHFADEVVRVFDRYRAALTEADVERRNPASLSSAQLRNLMRWGYPYVFESFRFHMTLSSRLTGEDRNRVLAIAKSYFAPVLERPVAVDALTLFVEPEPGAPFEIHSRVPLSSGRERKTA